MVLRIVGGSSRCLAVWIANSSWSAACVGTNGALMSTPAMRQTMKPHVMVNNRQQKGMEHSYCNYPNQIQTCSVQSESWGLMSSSTSIWWCYQKHIEFKGYRLSCDLQLATVLFQFVLLTGLWSLKYTHDKTLLHILSYSAGRIWFSRQYCQISMFRL